MERKLIPWCVVASVLSMLVECQAAVCKKALALAMPKDKASCNLNLLNLLFFKWCRTIQGLNCKLTYKKGLWSDSLKAGLLRVSLPTASIDFLLEFEPLTQPFLKTMQLVSSLPKYLDTFQVFKVQDIFAKYRLVQGCWIGREKKKLWKELAPHAHVCIWVQLSFIFETTASHW